MKVEKTFFIKITKGLKAWCCIILKTHKYGQYTLIRNVRFRTSQQCLNLCTNKYHDAKAKVSNRTSNKSTELLFKSYSFGNHGYEGFEG